MWQLLADTKEGSQPSELDTYLYWEKYVVRTCVGNPYHVNLSQMWVTAVSVCCLDAHVNMKWQWSDAQTLMWNHTFIHILVLITTCGHTFLNSTLYHNNIGVQSGTVQQ